MNIPRAVGLAQALASPLHVPKTEEAALLQIEVQAIARKILEALDAKEE